jgi:hypothetical protein
LARAAAGAGVAGTNYLLGDAPPWLKQAADHMGLAYILKAIEGGGGKK